MSIFGTVVNLPYKPGTIVFIAVLIALMCFEGVLNAAESYCHRNGLHGLIRKLYKEFMILGLISFTIFIISEVYHFDAEDEWYLSFEFAHIVFLFVGINFVLESFLLVALIEGRNKQLLRHDNSSSEQLLLDYLDLQRRGGIMKFLFDYGLVSIPVPELREKIEYKIIQEYFVRSYNLPAEFKFANYLCILLKTFVFSLLEVRPISWLIVAMLAVLNFLRVIVIDPIYQSHVCEKYYTHFHVQPSAYYGHHVCQEYTLRYFFTCSMFLSIYLICVFAASEMYMQRLIGKVLDEEEMLEQLEKEEEMATGGMGQFNASNNNFSAPSSAQQDRSLKRVDSNNSDMGELMDDFMVEAAVNMGLNGGGHDSSASLSGAAADSGSESASAASTSPSREPQKVPFQPMKPTRKVSYADVNTVSFHFPSSPPPARSEVQKEANTSMSNLSNISEMSSIGETMSLGPNPGTGTGRHYGISESLKYDLQSEDGESMLQKRQAAATRALNDVHLRKNTTVMVDGDEKQLRRSISEINVNKAEANRRHLYSLCLQRIMLVEFELIAHQTRKTVGPPPAPKKLEGRKKSIFGRLGSFFASTSRDPGDDAGSVGVDLELAAANSFKNASSQVRNVSRKMSSNYMGPAKTVSPQEFISSSSLSRRRSAHSMRSAANNESTGNFGGTSLYGNMTSAPPVVVAGASTKAASPTAMSGKSTLSATGRTYSMHFFEMQTSTRSKRSLGSHRRVGSMLNMDVPKDNACTKTVSFFGTLLKNIGTLLVELWESLIGHEEEDEEPDEDVAVMQDDLRTVFLWENPDLYFFTVEFALLAQCLYIALWATNFIKVAKDSYFPGLWEAALLLPVPFNFWLIQKTIFSACTLKAVVSLDRTVADKICEEALDARNVTERLRKIIRSTLAGLNFEKIKWNGFLHEQFHLFKKDGALGLSEKDMRLFLHSLQIFLTDTSVSRIFTVIDFDRDGRVTWKDLSDIVFPELTQQQLKVNRKANSTSKSMKSVKATKTARRKSLGGKSEKSATSNSSLKKATFGGNSSDEGSGKGPFGPPILPYRPSAVLSNNNNNNNNSSAARHGLSGLSVGSSLSGDFSAGCDEDKMPSDYTAVKEKSINWAAAAASLEVETDSDDSAEDAERLQYLSRFDQEDAEFGSAFVNHRSIALRNKLAQQKAEKTDEVQEEVFFDDNAQDFWDNAGESPLPATMPVPDTKKKKSIFFS